MFIYAKVDFENVLYESGPAPEWDRSCWTDVKFKLGLDFPNLPYLIDGEVNLTETVAIQKYIAKKWAPELLGSSVHIYATTEMLQEHCLQLKKQLAMPSYGAGPHGKDITCELCFKDSEQHLKNLVEFRDKKGFKWLASNELTWIDFYFWEMVDYCIWLVGKSAVFEKFPSLESYYNDFLAIP